MAKARKQIDDINQEKFSKGLFLGKNFLGENFLGRFSRRQLLLDEKYLGHLQLHHQFIYS